MGCSKKQLIWFTIVNLFMIAIMLLCVVVMKFNLLSLILSLISICSIFFSSISIWRHGKQLRNNG
ncbi:MAG: hypothetical protein IJX17_01355 [Clostridia bacterium]|nr:hypothetical protein [Clostridia bacterium]